MAAAAGWLRGLLAADAGWLRVLLVAALVLVAGTVIGAQPVASKPTRQATPACHAAALAAMQRRTQVAAYYDLKLALVSGKVFEWRTGQPPRLALRGAVQVAVAGSSAYAIDGLNQLIGWSAGSDHNEVLLDDTVWVAAGDSGLLAIRCDGSLWRRAAPGTAWAREAGTAIHAWVGDGADYYVDGSGALFVRGKAHRGQYGDGKLAEAPDWSRVATDAVAVVAHTGHALYLRRNGAVLGTGGNRFGPLGAHGYGDKADAWGAIFGGATQIATGSRHSLAIRRDGSLWIWGADEGLLPKRVLANVVAAAGGLDDSVALTADGAVWNWALGQAPKRLVLPP